MLLPLNFHILLCCEIMLRIHAVALKNNEKAYQYIKEFSQIHKYNDIIFYVFAGIYIFYNWEQMITN